jgi:hypothetical protein
MPQRQNHSFICSVTVRIQTKANGCIAKRGQLVFPTQYDMQAQRGSRGIAVLILNLRARWEWVVRHTTPHDGGCTQGKSADTYSVGPNAL